MKKRADGRYQKKITLEDGSKKTLYSTAANERLAQKDFTDQILRLEKKKKNSRLFSSFAEEWAEEHFPKVQNNTLKSYKSGYKSAVDYFGDIPIDQIKPITVQRYVDMLIRKKFSPKTIKNKMLVVGLIMKFAKFNEAIKSNPTEDVSLPIVSNNQKRDRATEIDQGKIFASTDKTFGVFALFLLTTGCRRGEALALTPKDIDMDRNLVKITKTVEWIGQKPQIKHCPKTDAGIREIPLHDSMIDLLRPLMNQTYLFPSSKGDLFPESQFERRWNTFCKEAEINCTPHQLRHSYATMLFDAGIDVKTAQRWLGHADIKTTLEIYTHLSESRLEKSTENIKNFIGEKFSKIPTK